MSVMIYVRHVIPAFEQFAAFGLSQPESFQMFPNRIGAFRVRDAEGNEAKPNTVLWQVPHPPTPTSNAHGHGAHLTGP
ncbi:unannotated protein [freshwater metagenome]|uniref:Unannotated protein n=1 Tax=freshwater metagenome TaxID=449393 RepID=A0A6J7ND93_9ZZZZ